jgi:hypothetical protein
MQEPIVLRRLASIEALFRPSISKAHSDAVVIPDFLQHLYLVDACPADLEEAKFAVSLLDELARALTHLPPSDLHLLVV